MLSPSELGNLLGKSGFDFDQSAIDKIVARADVNGDGMIDFEEFVPEMMRLGKLMADELFGKKVCNGSCLD